MACPIMENFDITDKSFDFLGPFLLYEDNTRVLLIKTGVCLPIPLNDDSTCNAVEIVHYFEKFYNKYGPGKYHFVYIKKIPKNERVADKYFELKLEPQKYKFVDSIGYTIDATEQYEIKIEQLKELNEWLADLIFEALNQYGQYIQPGILYDYNWDYSRDYSQPQQV